MTAFPDDDYDEETERWIEAASCWELDSNGKPLVIGQRYWTCYAEGDDLAMAEWTERGWWLYGDLEPNAENDQFASNEYRWAVSGPVKAPTTDQIGKRLKRLRRLFCIVEH